MKKNIASLGLILVVSAFVAGQDSQKTKNTADQVLRSNGRVNPSTLGMEFDLPVGSYAGRGFNLPLGLNYSSKVWRFEEDRTHPTQPVRIYQYGVYASDSAAGWTSSLAQPYIEYTGEAKRFNGDGRPLPEPNSPQPASHNWFVPRITVYLPGGESHELRRVDYATNIFSQHGTNPPSESEWAGIFYASDGSGLKYEENVNSSGIYRLYMPDGSYYDFSAARVPLAWSLTDVRKATRLTDVNGNYMQYHAPNTYYNPANISAPSIYDPYGSWTDQLGRVFPIMIPPETPQLDGSDRDITDSFTLPGMAEPYVLTWKRLGDAFGAHPTPYQLHYVGGSDYDQDPNDPDPYQPGLFDTAITTYDSCNNSSFFYVTYLTFNHVGSDPGTHFNPYVLTSVELPNGASYEFKYNEYGEVEQIHYPSGGREEFDYSQVASLANMAPAYQQTNRGVSEHSVFENDSDSSPAVSRYYAAKSDNNFRTTIVGPDGMQTDNFMHRGLPELTCGQLPDELNSLSPRWGYDSVLSGRTYETRVFSSGSSSQLIQRTFTKWEYSQNPDVIMRSSDSLKIQYYARVHSTQTLTYDGSSVLSAVTKFEYDTYRDTENNDLPGSPLNVTAKSEYSYSAHTDSSPPTPIPTSSPHPTPPPDVIVISDPTTGALFHRTETAYITESSYKDRNLLKLPTHILVKDGSGNEKAKTVIGYDELSLLNDYSGTVPGWSNPNTDIRGLMTSKTNWYDISGNQSIQTQIQYNKFGSPRKTWDGNGNLSQIEYTDNFSDNTDRHTFAFATKTISPAPNGSTTSFETTTRYKFPTGLLDRTIDVNSQITQMDYTDPATSAIDSLLRIHKITAPNGQETITEYGAGTSASTRWIKVKTQIDTSKWEEGQTWYDGLMRNVRTQTLDDAGNVSVLTCYDNVGRVSKVSNPFREYSSQTCSTTTGMNWTSNTFDTAGRSWKVTAPDSSVVETNYSLATSGSQIGTVVTVTDEAGKLRRSVTNALGQLLRIDEPTSAGLGDAPSPYQNTDYTYDILNNLLTVIQGSQTRTLTYDSLSRLKSANNPESGTIYYSYDANGNLISKKDARNIITSYSYDALNRLTERSYATPTATPTPGTYQNSPTVTYFYDNGTNAEGKLTKVVTGNLSSPVSTTEYTSFDILGRVTASKQTTEGGASGGYSTEYTYNLAGALIEEKYPSGRRVRNTLDPNGDLAMVESKKTESAGYWKYASNFAYNAAGAVTSLRLGNGRWERTDFNNRLQPIKIALGTVSNATNLLQLDYTYSTSGNHNNNGNILSQTITVPNSTGQTNGFTAVQTYTYDELNRLKSATEIVGTTEKWKQTFNYDRYGNRQFDQTNTTMPNSFSNIALTNPTTSTSTNRITSSGWTYDAAGNTLTDASGQSYVYDSENKQVKASNGSGTLGEYSYDGDGKRVKKHVPSTGETTIFVYDAAGKLVAEYSTVVASITNAKVAYVTNDHLGSPRINTSRDGNVTARHDYHPFGEEIITSQRSGHPSYASDTVRKQFTGYERDSETDLDFAQARYYGYGYGRFFSPDPIMMTKKRAVDPQSINLYVYTRNSPLRFVDPDGKEFKGTDGKKVIIEKEDGKWVIKSGNASDDLKRLVDMVNNSGSSTANSQFNRLNATKTMINFAFGDKDPQKTAFARNQPHGTRLDGTKGPLEFKGQPGKKKFEGKVDIVKDEKGNEVYKEATITIFEGEYVGTKSEAEDQMVADFGHEAEHDLDLRQVQETKNGKYRDSVYHPKNKDGTDAVGSPDWTDKQITREVQEHRKEEFRNTVFRNCPTGMCF